MSFDFPSRSWQTVTDRMLLLSRDDRFWLTIAVATGAWLHIAYLVSHQYPAYGAGLFLAIAEQISAHGYALPATIPGYTAEGVPFAYPPFWFYVAAVVRDLSGVGPFAYSLLVPGLLITTYLVPYYATARELLHSPERAGVATVLFAATPTVLQWHLSAGGMVRAGALLFALTGCYVGVRLFRDGGYRWLAAGTVLFGLTVLSHPMYTVFFGLSYLVLYAYFDRSLGGLLRGAVVAGGGVVVAAPWWLQVASTFGPEVFLAAAGTHSGLGGGIHRFATEFVYPIDLDAELLFFAGAYLGAGYALVRRRWLLPAWLFVPGYIVGKPRFQFVAGSMLASMFLFDVVLPRVREASTFDRRRTMSVVAVALLAVSAVGVGTLYASSALDIHHGSASQPPFVDSADVEAMDWAASNTPDGAQFVVLGDAAEWFPLLTDRPILIGPWGVEWKSPAAYQYQLSLYKDISTCSDAACVSAHLAESEVKPDYIYVPKDGYTVRGIAHGQSEEMRASMTEAPRYDVVFENDGVLVYRVDHDEPTGGALGGEYTDAHRRV